MKRLFATLLCLFGRCTWRSQGSRHLGGERVEALYCAKCGGYRYRQLTGEDNE